MTIDFDDNMIPNIDSAADNDTGPDNTGDISSNYGVDLNSDSDPTYSELMRGYSQEALDLFNHPVGC
jgi:hypothetical protein